MTDALMVDVRRVLADWDAPDGEQERLRSLFLAHAQAHSAPADRSCAPDHITASTIIFSSDANRFALVLHPKFGRWLQTGGHCEPADTSLAAAAEREAREESGISGLVVDPDPVLLSRHPVKCWPNGHHLDVQFVAVAPAEASLQVSAESLDIRWFDIAEVDELEDESVRRLVLGAKSRLQETLRPIQSSRND